MKALIVMLTLVAGSVSFAQGGNATVGKKISYKEAKMECKKEDKNLKGAELKKCIQGKKAQ